MNGRLARWLFLLFFITIFITCKKVRNVDGISFDEWSPDAAFPVLHTSLTASDILEGLGENSVVVEGTGGQLIFIYTSEGYRIDGDELSELIPDVDIPMTDSIFNMPYNLPNNIRIDYILVKEGNVGLLASSTSIPLNLRFYIPQLTLDNNQYERNLSVQGNFPTVDIQPVGGYTLRPENDTLQFIYEARATADGTPLILSSPVIVSLDSLKYSYAEGYLGNNNFLVPRDSIKIDLFNFLDGGELYFEEPKITVRVQNSFGFPLSVKFNVLRVLTTDGDVIDLGNPDLINGLYIDYPAINEVGAIKETIFTIDRFNSNIEDIIGQPVSLVDYDIEAVTNPDNDTTSIGFMTDSSVIDLDLELELPLYGQARNFTILDTFALDLSVFEEVQYADFKLYSENGFPVDAKIQIYFLDDNDVLLDSLARNFDDEALLSGEIGNDGKVIAPKNHTRYYPVNEERFSRLKYQGKQVVLKTEFSTTNGGTQSVRFYSHYNLDMHLGVIGGVSP